MITEDDEFERLEREIKYRLTNTTEETTVKLIDLHWSNTKGEGSVKYSKAFDDAHVVVRLDMLQDCINDLRDKYDSLLAGAAVEEKP
jgi:hypothetical protein